MNRTSIQTMDPVYKTWHLDPRITGYFDCRKKKERR